MKKLIFIGLAAVLAFAPTGALAALEIITNGGFETGYISPWTTDSFEVGNTPGYSHSGDYFADTGYVGNTNGWTAYIYQDLPFTVQPQEVVAAEFWVRQDYEGRGVNVVYGFYLGENHVGTNIAPILTWQHITFPKDNITAPFNYVKIELEFWDTGEPPFNFAGSLDDVSVTVTLSGVEPASLGRVKALYR